MLARIEVATRPELVDPVAQSLLRKLEMAQPDVRRKIRWGRLLEIYWLDVPVSREELIPAVGEVFWDRVLQWLFTGNLIPSAAGKTGGILDVMATAPNRPGRFYALERRFRPGVTDNVARTALEALEIVLGRKLPEARAVSGAIFLLEGADLTEDLLARVARDVFCNELIETWSIMDEEELKKSDRFHQERIKRDLPKVLMRGTDRVNEIHLDGLSDAELEALSKQQLWALTLIEMKAVRDHFSRPEVRHARAGLGLGSHITDVEMEAIAQTWSEHCKHKIFNARIHYRELGKGGAKGTEETIDSLFKTTIAGTTKELMRPWLLSVFEDNAGIVAFDEEDAFCIKVETHNSPSALDPYGGALTGIVGVNRDILGCGLGAKPIFNTDVFCVAPLDYAETLPDRLMHPRRILDGIRRGVEAGGNKSGIPTINGAVVFDERYLGKPLVYCGTGGFMPRKVGTRRTEVKEVLPGDRICMVGGRIGKDGIHGATFSSLALDEASPVSAVQLGDPITQKRTADFLLEARDLGLYRAITDNGAGGLSSSVGEMALFSGGASIDVSKAKVKYPGLKPFELLVSESQERMTLAVPAEQLKIFTELAERRGVEVSDLGEFTENGRFDIFYGGKIVGSLGLEFLHKGVPTLELQAEWTGRPAVPSKVQSSGQWIGANRFPGEGEGVLLAMLGRPNIASKEWMIRQYDHEVQGTSVIKPLHTVMPGTPAALSGPNDAAVIKPKATSDLGLAVGCGINPKLSDLDPFLMAQSVVDEAIRNVLCVGAEYGKLESVVSLVDNFCWPDPVSDPAKAAWLVRACRGLRDAALGLGVPLVSGKDSMKNDFRGKRGGQPVTISVPPTLLMTAVARVPDVKLARTADFKNVGDVIFLLGPALVSLAGSEFAQFLPAEGSRAPEPNWEEARRIYSWLGWAEGREQVKLRSVHDVSDGGMLVSIAESLIAHGYGAQLHLRPGDQWEFCFGEGFHTFVVSSAESDSVSLEAEWAALRIPYERIGVVTGTGKLELHENSNLLWATDVSKLRNAWIKGGYWE